MSSDDKTLIFFCRVDLYDPFAVRGDKASWLLRPQGSTRALSISRSRCNYYSGVDTCLYDHRAPSSLSVFATPPESRGRGRDGLRPRGFVFSVTTTTTTFSRSHAHNARTYTGRLFFFSLRPHSSSPVVPHYTVSYWT